jgi:hypothetical protein
MIIGLTGLLGRGTIQRPGKIAKGQRGQNGEKKYCISEESGNRQYKRRRRFFSAVMEFDRADGTVGLFLDAIVIIKTYAQKSSKHHDSHAKRYERNTLSTFMAEQT